MKTLKVMLYVLLGLVVVAVGCYAYMGGFSSAKVVRKEVGGEMMVYEHTLGDYKNSPVVMERVLASLKEVGVEPKRAVGVYYSDPKVVDVDVLESEIGWIIEDGTIDVQGLIDMRSKFNFKGLSRAEYLVVEFPYRNSLSILMGLKKALPALTDYAAENGINTGAITEIYDMPGGKIIYRAEIMKELKRESFGKLK